MASALFGNLPSGAYDQMVPGNAILGKKDTIIDLIMDTIGAVAAGVVRATMVES